jgi:hypothetical protein
MSFSFKEAISAEKDSKSDKDVIFFSQTKAKAIPIEKSSKEFALSTRTDVKGEAQSALIPSAPFGITGTVLSYLPVREIIGIHKQYPTEGREVAYGLSITPSPIFWNFHDSLYSRERFRDIFGRMGSQGNIALKLINLNVETLMMIAPLTILCAITRSVRQSPWQRRSICFGTPHSTSPSALKCGHKCF